MLTEHTPHPCICHWYSFWTLCLSFVLNMWLVHKREISILFQISALSWMKPQMLHQIIMITENITWTLLSFSFASHYFAGRIKFCALFCASQKHQLILCGLKRLFLNLAKAIVCCAYVVAVNLSTTVALGTEERGDIEKRPYMEIWQQVWLSY